MLDQPFQLTIKTPAVSDPGVVISGRLQNGAFQFLSRKAESVEEPEDEHHPNQHHHQETAVLFQKHGDDRPPWNHHLRGGSIPGVLGDGHIGRFHKALASRRNPENRPGAAIRHRHPLPDERPLERRACLARKRHQGILHKNPPIGCPNHDPRRVIPNDLTDRLFHFQRIDLLGENALQGSPGIPHGYRDLIVGLPACPAQHQPVDRVRECGIGLDGLEKRPVGQVGMGSLVRPSPIHNPSRGIDENRQSEMRDLMPALDLLAVLHKQTMNRGGVCP